ncbi:hypothetical protein HDU80_002095 [Chytriomyces hyalinus]|nr:hypothetical protein HDU80_002095 [Chytriomyces hyalinus]
MSNKCTDFKHTILNKTNYPVWKCLTLVAIGKVNARTLSPMFTPFVNHYLRSTPPNSWVKDLTLAEEFRDADDPDADDPDADDPDTDDPDADESDDKEKSETGSETATEETLVPSYKDYVRSEKIWLSFQKRAQEDDD